MHQRSNNPTITATAAKATSRETPATLPLPLSVSVSFSCSFLPYHSFPLWWKLVDHLPVTNPHSNPLPPYEKNSRQFPVPVVPISEARCTMGAGTKDKMPLIIAAKGTERWRAGEREGRRSEREGKKKKRQGALVCKPDTLAVTVNKLTERKTVT